MSGHGNQIFHDPNGARARLVVVIGRLLVVLLLCALALSAYGMFVAPSLPKLTSSIEPEFGEPSQAESPGGRWLASEINPAAPIGPDAAAVPKLAFADIYDFSSIAAFRRQAGRLDGVIFSGFDLTRRRDTRLGAYRLTMIGSARDFLTVADEAGPDILRIAAFGSSAGPAMWETFARSSDFETQIAWLADTAKESRISGVMVDVREVWDAHRGGVLRVMAALREALAERGVMMLAHVSTGASPGAMQSIADLADYVAVDLFQPSYAGASAGPLGAQGWVQSQIDLARRVIEPGKLIPVIGSFAETWRRDGFSERHSVQRAWEALEGRERDARFDADSLNLAFRGQRGRRDQEETWILDAASAFNHARAALSARPAALAVWRLGYEDATIWKILGSGRAPTEQAARSLEVIDAGDDAMTRRKGALVVVEPGETGSRSVAFSESAGLIVDQRIVRSPLQHRLKTWAPRDPKMIALTFDDGPDPRFTTEILNILDRFNAKATFYMLGLSAAAHPEIVRDIALRGHDLASHSYSHADMRAMTHAQLSLELNRFQRVLESAAGVRTTLFRPPYANPHYEQFITYPFFAETVGELGYAIGGIDVESEDWSPVVTADQIVNNTLTQLASNAGPVVLMHDSGADRTETVKALPVILEKLAAQGYRFVTTHELFGLTRDEVMPPLGSNGVFAQVAAQLRFGIFTFEGSIEKGLPLVALGMTGIGGVRLLLIGLGAFLQSRRHRRRRAARAAALQPPRKPKVCILVPGYNEEAVITMTVDSLLQSTYLDNLEIVVIDDGSKDGTWEVLKSAYSFHPKVRIFTKENGGKARALNFGLHKTDAEIVVCIDADTVLERDAIEILAERFDDPRVGSVAGNVVVGNRVNWITCLQAIEYVTAQNLDRRAFEMINAIGVVPGAIGAWRRQALIDAGGFPPDTLAEDADATVALLRDGWRIECAPEALAHTEAPQTLLQFMKQRHRWCFGTLQVAFKNLLMLPGNFRWNVAFIYIPNVFIFQFVFALLAPMVDGLLVYGLITSLLSLTQGGAAVVGADFLLLALFWALFQIIDFAVAAVGMALDRDTRNYKLLPWVMLQRIGFRQILYFVTLRALLAAVKGQFVGWGKLFRNASVAAPKSGGASAA